MSRIPEKARSKGIRIDEDKLVSRILEDYKKSKEWLSAWKNEATESWNNYYGILTGVKTEPWEGCANFFVPATAIMCDALCAIVFSRFRLPKPLLNIKALSETAVDKAQKVGHFLNYQVREELKLQYEVDGWILDALIEGTRVLMPHWSVDKRTLRHERTISTPIQEQNPATGLMEVRYEERIVTDPIVDRIEMPTTTVPDSEDILYPPILKDLQSCSYVIRRVYKTWDQIEEGKDEGIYYNIDEELKSSLVERYCDGKTIQDVKNKVIGVENALSRKVITIIEWYSTWNLGKGQRNEEVIVSIIEHSKKAGANGTIISGPYYLTEKYRHGMRPFIALRALKHGAGRFQGQSIPQKIKQTQEELNAIHNQRLDYGTLRNMPWILTDGHIQPQTIRIQPGAVVSFPGASTAKLPNFQGNPVFEMQEEVGYFQYLERQLPITDLRLGRSPSITGPSSTATGMTALLQQSDIRLQPILANIEAGVKDLVTHVHALDCQYLPPEKLFRIQGEEGEDVFLKVDNREELTGKFDFIIDMGSEDAQMERQLAVMRYQMMSQHPLMVASPIAQYELLKDLAINLGRSDIDKFIPKPPKELRRAPADPDDEHRILMTGKYQSPLPQENHIYHLGRHSATANDLRWQTLPEHVQQYLTFHINEHLIYMQREAMQERKGATMPIGAGMQGGMNQQFSPQMEGGMMGGGQNPQPAQAQGMGGQIPVQ